MRIYFALLSLLQLGLAAVLLWWAIPLLGNPPILGNGALGLANQIDAVPQLHGRGHIVPWLFWRLQEGLGLALVCAIFLLFTAIPLLHAAIALPRRDTDWLRRVRDAPRD